MRNQSVSMWFASALLLVLPLIPSSSDSATIAHWKFSEGTPGTVATGTGTVLDSSGNNLDGTPIGGPIYRPNGMEFDGVDDRIHIPDNDLFKLTGSLTLEAFINMPTALNHYSMIVARMDQRPGFDPYYLGVDLSNNRLMFNIQDTLNNAELLFSPAFPLNQYIHVAATLNDATGEMKIFVNGNEVATRITAIRPLADLDPTADPGVGIGGNGGLVSPGFEFGGIINEVRISDVALDPSQFLFDNVAPTVTSTSPQDQATGVAVNSAVAVTFSELVDTTSITSSTFIVSDGFSNIVGNITFTTVAGQTVATFTPTTNLSNGTTYTATITTGVTDDTGNALAQDYNWTFTTGTAPDTTPPTVNTTVPTSGASGVGIGSTISVTFSELMDTSTITGATFVLTGGGGGVTGTISFATSSGMTLATLTPLSPLAYATTYTGTVTTGVEDLAGNPMVLNHVWTFTTEGAPDTTPPAVISTTPANGTTGISISTPITVTFSEEMDASSIVPAVFILTGGGSNLPCTVNYSGAQATFTPTSNLANNTTHTATVTTLVEDVAGNPMASNFTWTFTTESASSSGGGGGGGGCAVLPTRKSDDQSPMGMILFLTLPAFVLLLRRTFR